MLIVQQTTMGFKIIVRIHQEFNENIDLLKLKLDLIVFLYCLASFLEFILLCTKPGTYPNFFAIILC